MHFFSGTHQPYLQYSQPDVRTIEGVLFEALVKAGAVSQDNANDPAKVLHSYTSGTCAL